MMNHRARARALIARATRKAGAAAPVFRRHQAFYVALENQVIDALRAAESSGRHVGIAAASRSLFDLSNGLPQTDGSTFRRQALVEAARHVLGLPR